MIESTLLVEALRIDHTYLSDKSFCEHCGMIMNSNSNGQKKSGSSQQKSSRLRSPATAYNPSISSDIPITTIRSHHDNYDHMH